jgi:phosphoribosylformimino-5-aminoimidazole carboxamide ribotide isomerase
MIVIPAIDLKDGRCVQLVGGSYDQQMIELEDPLAIARKWRSDGFEFLHVVDLDAATGRGSNCETVEMLLSSGIPNVQVGGGLRSAQSIERMIACGAARVVLGTRALTDRPWLEEMTTLFPDRIVVAADVRNRRPVIHGWKESIPADVSSFVSGLDELPLASVLVTAVHMEGLMKGPDLDLMRELTQVSRFPIQASGGITSMDDIRALSGIGVSAAIVGMALYTGKLTAAQVEEALDQ